jgi:hypothetical protein
MNLGLVKSGVQLISGFGVGLIADEAIKRVKPQNLVGIKNIAVKIGGFVLSAMVADKATDYVGEVIDKTVNDVKEFTKRPTVITEEEGEAE